MVGMIKETVGGKFVLNVFARKWQVMMGGGNWLAGSKDDKNVRHTNTNKVFSPVDKENKIEKLLSDIIVTYKS